MPDFREYAVGANAANAGKSFPVTYKQLCENNSSFGTTACRANPP